MPEPTPTTAPARPPAALSAVPPVRGRIAFVALIAAVLAVGAYQHVLKTQKLSRLGTQTKTAFLRWRTQILGDEAPGRGPIPGLKRGDDVYRYYNYPNPPVMALILWPLAELPPLAGAMLWYALKVVMSAAALVWAFRLCGPMPDWARAVAVLLSLHPILGDLSHGNVNLFIAFLVFGALEAYRRGWDLAAGLVLSLAVACKVTPALFLPYFGWKWVWGVWRAPPGGRAAALVRGGKLPAACVVGLGVWWLAVPGAVLGWERNLTLLESWYAVMVKPFVVEGKVTSEHANQSIPGVAARLLTAEPSVVGYDEEDRPYGAEYRNLADVGPDAARGVVRGFQAAWVLAVILLCRGREREGLRFAAGCSLVLLGMLLFSERTWKHHAVTLMLPYAVLAGTVARSACPGLRAVAAGALALAAVLTLGEGLLPARGQDLALTYGTHTAAFLVLTAGVCAVVAVPAAKR